MSLPLTGLRVIELGQLIAGPFASKILAEFGADVIKVEPPAGGDPLRGWRLIHEGTSVWWAAHARNKRSLTLDLRTPEGQGVVRELAKDADILIENFRPGGMEKWGLGFKDSCFGLRPNRPLSGSARLWRNRRGNGRTALPER